MANKTTQKITPFLWFDKEAREAAKFHNSIFKDSKIMSPQTFDGTPSGSIDIVPLEIFGQNITFMSAGPDFKINPSISFFIYCRDEEEIEGYWKGLSEGGQALMPLDKYPFAEKYGWIQDKFGVSWQLMVSNASEKQKLTPLLMFTGKNAGKTLEAIKFYTAVFSAPKGRDLASGGKNSTMNAAMHYEEGEGDKTEYIKHAEYTLAGQGFMAMDSGLAHDFTFNEAISFIIDCEDQEEVDYYWDALTTDGGEESQCGWLKDKFGVSWQVLPRRLNELLEDSDKEKAGRAMQAMLKMKKIIVKELEEAFNGDSKRNS